MKEHYNDINQNINNYLEFPMVEFPEDLPHPFAFVFHSFLK